MAKTTITKITDDLDGSDDALTYHFAWQGSEYSIDLSAKNFQALDEFLKPYVHAAEKVSSSTSTRRTSRSSPRKDFAAIRKWAKEQNLQVSERGRVPKSIVLAYEESH